MLKSGRFTKIITLPGKTVNRTIQIVHFETTSRAILAAIFLDGILLEEGEKMNNKTHHLRSEFILPLIGLALAMAINLAFPHPISASPGASARFAAPAAAGSGDCSSWTNPCTLKTALSLAANGDQIWVKKGVHKPGLNRTDNFTLKDGVAVYGGFTGTETLLSQRDWATNVTALSGDIDNNDVVDLNGVTTTINGANSYHVVKGGGVGSTAVLDGFVITGGQANYYSAPDYNGGGMYNDNSSPTLINLTFSCNEAQFNGGGMYNRNSSPTLTMVTLNDNKASVGGGIFNNNSSPTLNKVTFRKNVADANGGGIFNTAASNPTLTSVTFSENTATFNGGGMDNQSSSPTLTGVTFDSNNAGDSGGGIFNYNNSSPKLTEITFRKNVAHAYGGGMINFNASNPTLTNITFSENTAFQGGGIYNDASSPTLTNVTFFGNSADNDGGGIYNTNSQPALVNSVLWENTTIIGGSQISNYNASNPTFSYSDIQGCGGSGSGWDASCGTDGGSNIDLDPLFVSLINLRLQPGSPVINAGDNNAPGLSGVTTDLAGNPRVSGRIVDMGAFEYQIFMELFLPLTRRN